MEPKQLNWAQANGGGECRGKESVLETRRIGFDIHEGRITHECQLTKNYTRNGKDSEVNGHWGDLSRRFGRLDGAIVDQEQ